MLTLIRHTGRPNLIVLEGLGTDSKVEGSTFPTQLSTPGLPETEHLNL